MPGGGGQPVGPPEEGGGLPLPYLLTLAGDRNTFVKRKARSMIGKTPKKDLNSHTYKVAAAADVS